MRLLWCFFILFILLVTVCFGDKIVSPPPLPGENNDLQHYLNELYRNFHNLEVVTSTPNGTRNGKKGDILFYQNGTVNYLAINTDSSTTWSGIPLEAL